MKPKEKQEKLGINNDRIKLFKKEGVFSPENPPSGNRGTNYTETDYENIRFIIVLTKSGLTCSDIRKMQDGECTLEEAIEARKKYIEDDMAKKRNSLELLSELQNSHETFESFNTDRYWNVIADREAKGEEFIDVEDMYGYEPIDRKRTVTCPYCGEEQEIDLEDYEYDQSSYESEWGMGPDAVYSFDSEDNVECPLCKRKYRVHGWIREYPMGSYDSEEIQVEEIPDEEQ